MEGTHSAENSGTVKGNNESWLIADENDSGDQPTMETHAWADTIPSDLKPNYLQ